jgi:20S proteasome alpha/beta subunit
MTLIVGILCSNGVVVGADSAATMGSLGNRTVIQPTKKLEIISDRVVLGVSGPVGLGQRFAHELATGYSAGEFASKPPVEAMTMISTKFRSHMAPEYQAAQMAQPIIGNGLASTDTITTSVVSMVISDKAELFQFDQQGAPEKATQGLPFVSIGSGQPIADPFLCFLRKIFWETVEPNLNEGIFATLWTLQHAIEINAGGVAGPIHIATLTKESTGRGHNTEWKARELGDTELQEHVEAVKAAEQKLANFREEIVSEEDATEIPTPGG